jgi:hypothetical protein
VCSRDRRKAIDKTTWYTATVSFGWRFVMLKVEMGSDTWWSRNSVSDVARDLLDMRIGERLELCFGSIWMM